MKELLREESWDALALAGAGRSCDAVRKDCRALGFCGRSQSINHGSLGCSFRAFLHFPIWTPLHCWGADNRARDKQQEETALRQELLRNKEPLVPAARAEKCSRMPRCGWQSSYGSPIVCQGGSSSVLQGIPALLLFQCPPAAQAFQPLLQNYRPAEVHGVFSGRGQAGKCSEDWKQPVPLPCCASCTLACFQLLPGAEGR